MAKVSRYEAEVVRTGQALRQITRRHAGSVVQDVAVSHGNERLSPQDLPAKTTSNTRSNLSFNT